MIQSFNCSFINPILQKPKAECIYDFLINVEEISAVKGIASIIPMLDEIPLIVSRTINAVENK